MTVGVHPFRFDPLNRQISPHHRQAFTTATQKIANFRRVCRSRLRCQRALLWSSSLRAVDLVRTSMRYHEAEYQARPADDCASDDNPQVAAQQTRSYQLRANQDPHTKGAVYVDIHPFRVANTRITSPSAPPVRRLASTAHLNPSLSARKPDESPTYTRYFSVTNRGLKVFVTRVSPFSQDHLQEQITIRRKLSQYPTSRATKGDEEARFDLSSVFLMRSISPNRTRR